METPEGVSPIDPLVQRALDATAVHSPQLLDHREWWGVHSAIVGAALNLAASRCEVEKRLPNRLGPFTAADARQLREDFLAMARRAFTNGILDWRATPTAERWITGYFINHTHQYVHLIVDRVVASLHLHEFPEKKTLRGITSSLKCLGARLQPSPLHSAVRGLWEAFAHPGPGYARQEIRRVAEVASAMATVPEFDEVLDTSRARCVAFCWGLSIVWRHGTRDSSGIPGTTQRLYTPVSSCIEWVWALRALEEAARLWNLAGSHCLAGGASPGGSVCMCRNRQRRG